MSIPSKQSKPGFSSWYQAELGEFPPGILEGLELTQLEPGLWASHWPIAELCGHQRFAAGETKVMVSKRLWGGWAFLYVDDRISLSLRSAPALETTEEAQLFRIFLKRCAAIAQYLGRLGKVKVAGTEDELQVIVWPDGWNDRDLCCHFKGEDSRSFWANIADVAEML